MLDASAYTPTMSREAVNLKQAAKKKRLMAPKYDPLRYKMDYQQASEMELDGAKILVPAEPLQTGTGGEIVPPYSPWPIWVGISP